MAQHAECAGCGVTEADMAGDLGPAETVAELCFTVDDGDGQAYCRVCVGTVAPDQLSTRQGMM